MIDRALVIGGSGFLGSATARGLADRGYDVVSMSRSGRAGAGRGISGDVRVAGLGLSEELAAELRETVTHVVACFGSVDWDAAPGEVHEVHVRGTGNVLDFAASCERLERLVHVSSVLALGRAKGTIRNDDLDVGQSFRNWYEYGKFHAEALVRREQRVPWRIVRLGPVLGTLDGAAPSPRFGILRALPYLLRGFPVPLEHGGRFDCYPCDVATAAVALARALEDDAAPPVWTYCDERRPTLAQAFAALCRPWGMVPRITDSGALARPIRLLAPRLGLPRELVSYGSPWVELDEQTFAQRPRELPPSPPGYLAATGAALRTAPELELELG